MPEASDRFALPLLAAAQAQKEITHNEALTLVDGLLHAAAETQTLAAPPVAPAAGQAWLVAPGGSGAWAGMDDALAIWTGGGWRFARPRPGMLVWLSDAGVFAVFRNGTWRSDGWPAAALAVGSRLLLGGPAATVAAPAGGATIDAEARAAVNALRGALSGLGLLA